MTTSKNLPRAVLFSDRGKIKNFAATIANLPKNSAIIFREYDLKPLKKRALAQELLKEARKFKHRFLIGKDFALARQIKADGVHFSDRDLLPFCLRNKKVRQKKLPKNFLLSFACHDLRSIRNCQKPSSNLSPDLLFLSPIFPSSSHPNQEGIGIFNWRKAAKFVKKNGFYPLGGVNSVNFKLLQKTATKSITPGFGAIDFFAKN